MKKIAQGFTLIEVMIVIAIIGVLAALAIPSYQDYTARTKIAEGLQKAGPAKLAVSEMWQSNTSMVPPTITITYDENSISGLTAATNTIILSPTPGSGALLWDCRGGTVPPSLRPTECR